MPPPTSIAREFLKGIQGKDNPLAHLVSIAERKNASTPFFEGEWIEFKGEPKDEKDTKRLWSTALSGFANTNDGLIIWGIDARKEKDIDAAIGTRLITDPNVFQSRLLELSGTATSPPVQGVEYAAFREDSSGKGILICLIPLSEHRPHRAEHFDRQYYIRAGGRFVVPTVEQLRSLFFPRHRCWFELELTIAYTRPEPPPSRGYFPHEVIGVQFSCSIKIKGTKTARYVYVTMHDSPDLSLGFQPPSSFAPVAGDHTRYAFNASRPLHPGETVDLFRDSRGNYQFPGGHVSIFPVLTIGPLDIEFHIYAADQEPQRIRLGFERFTTDPNEPKPITAKILEDG